MTLASQTHLYLRNGTYYFRRRVPTDLLQHYHPKAELNYSLKTKDRREAERLARLEAVRVDAEFHSVRRNLAATSIEVIPPEDVRKLSDAWIAHLLEEDEELRIEGLTERDYRKLSETLDIVNAGSRYELARGQTQHIEFEMEDFCASHGFNIAPDSQAHKQLSYAFLRATVEATSRVMLRHQGELVDTPEAPKLGSAPKPKLTGLTLADILDKWKLERKPAPKTLLEWEMALRIFKELHGDLTLDEITKSHIVAFKDKRIEDGRKWATVKKQLGALHSLLQYATDNDYIPINPASGVRVIKPKVDEDERQPFNSEDLKRIFGNELFTHKILPPLTGPGKRTDAAGDAAYWIPLLALYTGARLNELGQLTKVDIVEAEEFAYIDLTNRGRKSIKTNSSKRKVPVHPELIRLGFLDYCRKQSGPLFPLLKFDSKGSRTQKFSDWFNQQFLRPVVGITDSDKVFHSFRHTFKDACRNSGIPKEIHDAFTGHSSSSAGDGYGSGYSVKVLAEWMERLSYDYH